ncbi:MAG: hypothetical protein ABFS32_03950 [Bacteroidota bacterium]
MKIRYALIALTLVAGLLINGCKPEPDPGPSEEEQQIEKLSKTWVPASTASAITIAGNDVSSDWSTFTLTLGDKTYSSTSANSAEVWPSSGTWDFLSAEELGVMVRDNTTNITITVTDSSLLMEFDYSTGGRVNGIEGTWRFNMVPQ